MMIPQKPKKKPLRVTVTWGTLLKIAGAVFGAFLAFEL